MKLLAPYLPLVLKRLLTIALLAYVLGWAMNKSMAVAGEGGRLPGFGAGVVHGVLMPGAMPSLLMGRDIVIYAPQNNGRSYKLGYTFGVNACGAVFFGVFYWRLSRLRRAYHGT